MMECSYCEGWFHYNCVKSYATTDYNCIDRFCCRNCIIDTADPNDPARRITTYKRTCGLVGCKQPARLEIKNKYCSDAHEREWAKRMVAKLSKEEQAKYKAVLEQCPPGMAQYAGTEPGNIPGIDLPLEGYPGESPFWRRLNSHWDTDDTAEEIRKELLTHFHEDTGGYKYLHDKTVRQQKAIISEREEQKRITQLRLNFLDAVKHYSRAFVAKYKEENNIDLTPPKSRAKLSMNNPANDICGYDYRMHANDEWYEAWSASIGDRDLVKAPEDDASASTVFTAGGVEEIDPKTVSGTVCIRIKCKTHFDWALIASNHLRTTLDTINNEIRAAEELCETVDFKMHKKNAAAKLGEYFRQLRMKKLNRDQLELFRELVGDRQFERGDIMEEFLELFFKVKQKLPGEIAEPEGIYDDLKKEISEHAMKMEVDTKAT